MDFREFAERKGAEWVSTTVSRLNEKIEDNRSLGEVTTAICLDFGLERELSKRSPITRDTVYDGLTELLLHKV